MVWNIFIGVLIFVGLELLVRHIKRERDFKNKLNSYWKEPIGKDDCEHNFNVFYKDRVSCSKCGKTK
jgi:hypothetical protein